MKKDILLICILLLGCKSEWLDIKPNKSLVIPTNITDAQALLDFESTLLGNQITLGEIASDGFFVPDANWNALTNGPDKFSYIWDKDIYRGGSGADWRYAYEKIFISNSALDVINKIEPTVGEQASYNNVKGSALFYRAYNHLDLSNHFAVQYNAQTALSDPGIPLRLSADVNEKIERRSNKIVFEQIVSDFTQAATLLPISSEHVGRPIRAAAYGGLARCYLIMGDYANALTAAEHCLQLKGMLLNYNTISTTSTTPFQRFSPEVIFQSNLRAPAILRPANLAIDQALFNQYNNDDLRKSIFFTSSGGQIRIKGGYSGTNVSPFGGIAVDEIFLIRAECLARTGKYNEAMTVLNDLLKTRWKSTAVYPIQTASNPTEALSKILLERRKELVYRGQRWLDLRRLNYDINTETTIGRSINGNQYTLLPRANNYVFPIPDEEIRLSGIAQNPRD